MGSKRINYLGPVRRVAVPTFELSRSEVTVAQYRRCVRARVCAPPKRGQGSTWYQTDGADMPVTYVTWNDARTYAKWATARLPSEAEWEYAARSRGKDKIYPWGNARPTCSLVAMSQTGCRLNQPQAVCLRPAGHTEQGLCDMAGNVWEWTEDGFHYRYTNGPTDGSAWTSPGERRRMVRGGSWAFMPSNLTTRYRSAKWPNSRHSYIGFRVARAKP